MISNGDKVLVGFSGGADSLFLMEMLITLKKYISFELYAAHLNHGIRGDEADRDAEFTRDYCQKNDIKFFIKSILLVYCLKNHCKKIVRFLESVKSIKVINVSKILRFFTGFIKIILLSKLKLLLYLP